MQWMMTIISDQFRRDLGRSVYTLVRLFYGCLEQYLKFGFCICFFLALQGGVRHEWVAKESEFRIIRISE